MTIGTLVAFTALQANLFRPLMGVLNVGVQITASRALFSRIFEYLDMPVTISDPERPVSVDVDRAHGALSIENVWLTYPGAPHPALAEITLDVPAGATIAVVGATGSGKSTLASLISRLRPPDDGSVRIERNRARAIWVRPGNSPAWSGSSPRRPICCTPPSRTTSATPARTPPWSRSSHC